MACYFIMALLSCFKLNDRGLVGINFYVSIIVGFHEVLELCRKNAHWYINSIGTTIISGDKA